MGGWLQWPTDEAVYSPGSLNLPLRVERRLLNDEHDPDISFAYFFSGSINGTDAANATAERGRAKAQFEKTFVNHEALAAWQPALGSLFLVRGADTWKATAGPEGRLDLPPQVLRGGKGRSAWTATFCLGEKPGLIEAEATLDGTDLAVHACVKPGVDLKAWALKAASKLKKACVIDRAASRKIAAAGVARRGRSEDD